MFNISLESGIQTIRQGRSEGCIIVGKVTTYIAGFHCVFKIGLGYGVGLTWIFDHFVGAVMVSTLVASLHFRHLTRR